MVAFIAVVLRLYFVMTNGHKQITLEIIILGVFSVLSIFYIPILLCFGVFHSLNVICDFTTREVIKNRDHEKDLQRNCVDVCFGPIRLRVDD